jgi:hypothetical protein
MVREQARLSDVLGQTQQAVLEAEVGRCGRARLVHSR